MPELNDPEEMENQARLLTQWLVRECVPCPGPHTGMELITVLDKMQEVLPHAPEEVRAAARAYQVCLRFTALVFAKQQAYVLERLTALVSEDEHGS